MNDATFAKIVVYGFSLFFIIGGIVLLLVSIFSEESKKLSAIRREFIDTTLKNLKLE